MNSWLKIWVPVIIALLLVTASVGITLAATGGNAARQVASPVYSPVQTADTQYAQGPLCPNCPGYGQGSAAASPDDAVGNVYIPGGAKCPNCPGYGQGAITTPGQQGSGITTYRGGCCGR